MDNYVYIFKEKYYDILKDEYKEFHDKISYEDIKEINSKYDLFVRKLMLLIINDKKIYNLRELFYSSNILDRLKALKDSREYIKLVRVTDVNKKRN